jgi:hypothetical protein
MKRSRTAETASPQMVKSVLSLIFVSAVLLRSARVFRVDFAPWWDGVGWGYADLWTSQAADLAFNVSTAGLDFRTEGLVYVPLLGIFLKIFGFTPGMEIWAWVLVLISATIPVMAAGTVHALTGRLGGAVLVAILVTLDPVQEAFGLNGWSDSITFFAVSLSFLTFARAAARPTRSRLVALGMALGLTALSHATWTWPAMSWAVMSWPLLAFRRHWWTTGNADHPGGPTIRLATPLLAFLVTILVVNFLVLAIAPESADNLFPVLSSDTNNQRALISTLNPDVEWDTWEPADTVRTLLFVVPGRFPSLLADLIGQQITGVMHLSTWLLLGMGAALLYIASTVGRKTVSRGALLALPVFAWLAWSSQATFDATVPALILTMALAWIYVPQSRGLFIAILPITALLAIFLPHNTHFRHSNAILYAVLIVFGLVVDAAAARWQGGRFKFSPGRWDRVALTLRLAPAGLVVILLAWAISQSAAAYSFRRAEDSYLRWLGTIMEPGDLLLTSGNVNPWRVQRLIGSPVVYDVEHGSRLFVTGDSPTWGPRLSAIIGTFETHEEFLATLSANGRNWFYRPGSPAFEPLVVFSQLGADTSATYYSLDPVAHFPDDPTRPAFVVGQPLEDDRSPPDLPSQTGRG